jgi:hypothetical protein
MGEISADNTMEYEKEEKKGLSMYSKGSTIMKTMRAGGLLMTRGWTWKKKMTLLYTTSM